MSAQPLARAFRQIGGMTAVSRILGFFRDVVFAMLLGAGPASPRRSGMMATRRPWRSPEKRRRHSRWFLWLS